ncbi:hypothetical protein F2P81_018577 [Scophthalmus maximus]|uniref:Uncharacterized protein n=1 Tax=Scophthalmus maximus TaxID=52904 RepID=A0A6A4SGI3_SCOMX|nr:hypothetical protein F2P81_018577 [Scophthalmus maximus]
MWKPQRRESAHHSAKQLFVKCKLKRQTEAVEKHTSFSVQLKEFFLRSFETLDALVSAEAATTAVLNLELLSASDVSNGFVSCVLDIDTCSTAEVQSVMCPSVTLTLNRLSLASLSGRVLSWLEARSATSVAVM